MAHTLTWGASKQTSMQYLDAHPNLSGGAHFMSLASKQARFGGTFQIFGGGAHFIKLGTSTNHHELGNIYLLGVLASKHASNNWMNL